MSNHYFISICKFKSVKADKTKAYFTLCKKDFGIENSGVSQVNSYSTFCKSGPLQ